MQMHSEYCNWDCLKNQLAMEGVGGGGWEGGETTLFNPAVIKALHQQGSHMTTR